MSYVVEDVVARCRTTFGVTPAWEWQRFLVAIGFDWYEDDLPERVPALLCDDFIVLQRGMTQAEQARQVWHEIGHRELHVGDRDWWYSRPQGHITVAKMERQANEFADTFAVWESEG